MTAFTFEADVRIKPKGAKPSHAVIVKLERSAKATRCTVTGGFRSVGSSNRTDFDFKNLRFTEANPNQAKKKLEAELRFHLATHLLCRPDEIEYVNAEWREDFR